MKRVMNVHIQSRRAIAKYSCAAGKGKTCCCCECVPFAAWFTDENGRVLDIADNEVKR
jgi:hypothetical protein